MPELIGYSEDGTPQYSFSDEDKLKGISVRPHNALLDQAPVEAEQSALPVDVTGIGAVLNQTTGFTAADRLFGLNGQERFQTWPERMVRSGVSLAHDVATGELPVTTLRREDVTDEPAPQGATADSPLIGRLLNLSPIAADPRDPLIERAQDMAGLAGGATLGINPAEMTVASGMTRRMSPNPEKMALNEIVKNAAAKGVDLQVDDALSGPYYNLSWIESKGLEPKAGTKAILDLAKLADQNNKKIQLIALADDQPGGQQLVKYYQALGFKKTGETTPDGPVMVRKPNAPISDKMQFKLTKVEGNPFLASDTQKPGMALSALEKPAPVFYSALENAVNNITANKMPADQWLGTLTNAKGVRPEEMEWTGLKDFLAEQKGPVTKDQVQKYLDANKVELKEVNKGDLKFNKDSKYALPEVVRAAKEAGETPGDLELTLANDRNAYRALTKKFPELSENEDWAEVVAKDVFGGDSMPAGTSKFSKYQLAGGENYRETLLTLPIKSGEAGPKGWGNTDGGTLSNANPANFRSSHWDEPNVLAHVRMNDRTIDGKKSLHLEEIQSDWHQLARDKGYAISADKIEKLRPQFDKIDNKLLNSNDEQILGHPEVDGMLKMAVDKKIITPDEAKIYKQVSDTAQTGAVPDAPFKKTWHELVLKRMLREAAEKGYDRLSWTPGEAQATRYDLSKQVSELTYSPQSKELKAQAWNGGQVINEKNVPPEKLADYVGKEAADKLINNPTSKSKNPGGYKLEGNGPWSIYTGSGGFVKDFNSKTKALEELNNLNAEKIYHHLSGLDLKVGGEGMKGFYDQIIPKALEKIGKEHGVKVKQGETPSQFEISSSKGGIVKILNSKKEAEDWMKNSFPYGGNEGWKIKQKSSQPIHYIDILQSLKDQALRKGFPLFSSGVTLSPITNDPFFDKEYDHDAHTKWRNK